MTPFVDPLSGCPVRLSGDNGSEPTPAVVPPPAGTPGSATVPWPAFDPQDLTGRAGIAAAPPDGLPASRGSTIGKPAPIIAALQIVDRSDDKGDEPGSAHLPVESAVEPDLGIIGSDAVVVAGSRRGERASSARHYRRSRGNGGGYAAAC